MGSFHLDSYDDEGPEDAGAGYEYGQVTVVSESDDGIQCREGGRFGHRFWVPRSQLHPDSEVSQKGDEGLLVVTEWLAVERGWV